MFNSALIDNSTFVAEKATLYKELYIIIIIIIPRKTH